MNETMVLADISPYWLGDPLVADALGEHTAAMTVGGAPGRDPALVAALPGTPIPVPAPEAYGSERARSAACFDLPFPYLPADVWMRRPAEPLGVWQYRVVHALDLTGLLARGRDDMPVPAPVEGAPNGDTAKAERFRSAWDGGPADPDLNAITDRTAKAVAAVWPDGYPVGEEISLAVDLMRLSLSGSAVIAAQRALAFGERDAEDRAYAVRMLARMKEVYGPLFDPKSMEPAAVADWVKANGERAVDLVTQLADTGLEAADTADRAREVFAA